MHVTPLYLYEYIYYCLAQALVTIWRMTCKVKKELGYPIYGIGWVGDEIIVTGGGGGTSKSGVSNNITTTRVKPDFSLEEIDNFSLARGDDAVMSMDVQTGGSIIAGINGVAGKRNEHMRVFAVNEGHISEVTRRELFTPREGTDDYQKATRLSADGSSLLLLSAMNELVLLKDDYSKIAFRLYLTDILDADISLDGAQVAVVFSNEIAIFNDEGTRIKSFDAPPNMSFRHARFTKESIIASAQTRIQRTSSIISIDLLSSSFSSRKLGRFSITALDVSSEWIACATSDFSIVFLSPKLRIHARSEAVATFTITRLSFDPAGKRLACASVDTSMSVFEPPSTNSRYLLYMFIFLLLIALSYHYTQ